MNALLKLAVLLLASSCVVSASADQSIGRKADAGANPAKFHKHGGLLAAGEQALEAVEHAMLRMLKAEATDAEKKAKKLAKQKAKKLKNKAKKQKAKKKCKKQCKKKIDPADKKGLKSCVKKCVSKAMKKKKGGSYSSTLSAPGYGGYYGGYGSTTSYGYGGYGSTTSYGGYASSPAMYR